MAYHRYRADSEALSLRLRLPEIDRLDSDTTAQ